MALTCSVLVGFLSWHCFSRCEISWLWLLTREVSVSYFFSRSL